MDASLIVRFGLEENKELAPFATYKIGGRARWFYEAKDKAELIELLNALYEIHMPFAILGGGSNSIFASDIYEGVVIKNNLSKLFVQENRITAQSGVMIGAFNTLCREHGLSGLEMLTGVPGTIGGVVWNNAGAFGMETSQIVTGGEVWHAGKTMKVDHDFFRFSYRHSIFKETREYVLLEAYFEMKQVDKETITQRMKEILHARLAKEPKGPSCGSFFRNPEGHFVGKLLEDVGAKGMRVGGIEVAQEHANWFINRGGGTVQDLIELKDMLKSRVKERFGIDLQEEIDIIRA